MADAIGALVERYSYRPDLTRRLERLHKLAGQVLVEVRAAPIVPPPSLRFRLTNVQRRALATDYQDGIPTTELTSRYKLSKGSVLKFLDDAGVQMRRQGLSPDQMTQAIHL